MEELKYTIKIESITNENVWLDPGIDSGTHASLVNIHGSSSRTTTFPLTNSLPYTKYTTNRRSPCQDLLNNKCLIKDGQAPNVTEKRGKEEINSF